MRETAIPKLHSHDLRKGRISETGRIYLITTVTHERQPFFQDWRCGRLVVKALIGESAQAQTLAFVVMPDHLHWLLQLGENTTLPTVVRHVKSVSAHHLNQALNRKGKVWQAGYHDHGSGMMKMSWVSPAMWWPIHCARGWLRGWGIIPYGTRFGCQVDCYRGEGAAPTVLIAARAPLLQC